MASSEASETQVLENVLSRYEAEGYDIFLHPSPSILPAFMRDYRPDAVALSPNKNIAIELVHAQQVKGKQFDRLKQLFTQHPNWEFRVLYMTPRTEASQIAVASRQDIDNALHQILRLKADGHRLPALIMAWATLEAIGRVLLPGQLARPQTPARLIEVLASDGYVTPGDADDLRAAIQIRNAAVHGRLNAEIEDGQLLRFIDVVQRLADYLREQVPPPA